MTEDMLSEALTQYLDNANDPEEQTHRERAKLAAAQTMLDNVNAQIAARAIRWEAEPT